VAKLCPKGSLNAFNMLDEDKQLFMHAFQDADMQVWEEIEDTGEMDSSGTDSEEEDKLTGEDLLQDLDKAPMAISPPMAPKARSSCINWPKRILRQTILVSSNRMEIESNIDRTDWDENCYKECRKLLQHAAEPMKDISKDRGTGEIPVLVDLEVQPLIAEALEGATHTLELMGDRITQIGVQCTSRDGKRSQNESSDPSPAAKSARQAVLEAAKAGPLSDSQLEMVIRLALGKRVPVTIEASKAVVACAAAPKASGDDAPCTPGAAFKFARMHQPKRRLEPEDKNENRSPEPTEAGESPPAGSEAQSTPPELRQVAAQVSPAAPMSPLESTAAPSGVTVKAKKKKARTKAAEMSASTATGAGPREAPLTAKAGSEVPPAAEPSWRKRGALPCVWMHSEACSRQLPNIPGHGAEGEVDLVHRKQLSLFCLLQLMGRECWTMGKWPNCTIDGCSKPHHEMLREVLKAGKPSEPTKKTEPQNGPPAAVGGSPSPNGTPETGAARRIDPDTLDVRKRVQGQREQERLPGGGGAAGLAPRETGGRKLSGKLIEAYSQLCQAGKRFVSYMGESRQQMTRPVGSVEASEEASPEDWDGLEARDRGCTPRREGVEAASPVSAVQGTTGDTICGNEVPREMTNGGRTAVRMRAWDEEEGRRQVVVLTPEGGQPNGVRCYKDSELAIVSRAVAVAARCGTDRAALPTPLMLEWPAGMLTCTTKICTMVFPLEGSQGRKLEIHASVVDMPEEYYGVP
jgi:hypothetical protein